MRHLNDEQIVPGTWHLCGAGVPVSARAVASQGATFRTLGDGNSVQRLGSRDVDHAVRLQAVRRLEGLQSRVVKVMAPNSPLTRTFRPSRSKAI
jgi:hypothetical protein